MDINELSTQVIAGVHIMGTQSRSTPLDNPNIDLNDPESWEQIFGTGMKAETGEMMNAEKSFTIAAVWQAVNLISGDIAKLPLMLYTQAESGVRSEVKKHPLISLVQEQPNSDENAFKFWRRVMVHALIWNNAYIYAPYDRSNGYIKELYHLLPDRTMMKHVNGELWCVTEVNGAKEYLPAAEVLHIEGISYNCIEGASLIHSARNSWALALSQEKFASKFFKHGGRTGGILEIPTATTKPVQDKIEEGFRKMYEGAENPFKTVILRDSAKFHAAQSSPADSQLVEGTEQQVRQVARWFNLSPSKLGLSDSVSYNSKSEDNQGYLDTTLSHWLKSISMEATIKMLSPSQRSQMWFEHDTTELLKMNPLQRSQFYAQLISSEVINRNEARRMENMQPYAGGDKFENPNTGKGQSQEKPADKTNDNPMNKPKARDVNIARMVFRVASNARHKAKNSRSFIEWIDGGWVSHKAECREVGVDISIIESMLADYRNLSSYATQDELLSEVNKLSLIHERDVYEH